MSSHGVSHRPITRNHADLRQRTIKQSDVNDCLSDNGGESELENNVRFHNRDRKLLGRSLHRDYSSDSCNEERRDRRNFRSPPHRSPTSDESEVPRDRRMKSDGYMKPEKFNGTTCFETFLVQFNNSSQFNQWNEKKLQYLRWSLTGTAAQMLWGTEGMSFRQLVTRLRARFGSLDMEEKYQTEIQCRRRKPDETLRELAQDIRRLMMLAYPGDRSAMAERLAKEHFLCALDDPELELKVREKEPQDLDSALKAAQRLEVFRGAVRQRSSARQRVNRQVTELPESASESLEDRVAKIEQSMHGSQGPESSPKRSHQQSSQRTNNLPRDRKRNPRQHTCAANVNGDDSWKEDILKKVRDLEAAQQAAEANTKKITAENDALSKEVGRLRHLEQMRSIPSLMSNPVARPGNASQSGSQPNKCFNCGEMGHYAKSCPRPRVHSNVAAQPQNGGIAPLLVKGTSGFSGSNLDAFLRVTIGNQVYDCLLDTGSEVCLFPEHIVDPAYIRSTSRTLKAANGTSIPIQGEATLTIGIGQFATEITGLISRHITEPMLGVDFLVENGAVWDFNNSRIRLGGRTFS